MMPGFTTLEKDHQAAVSKMLKPKKAKKESKTEKIEAEVKKENEDPLEKALRKQNKALWSVKDKLKADLTKGDMQELLMRNKIDVPAGEANILEACADLGRVLITSLTDGLYIIKKLKENFNPQKDSIRASPAVQKVSNGPVVCESEWVLRLQGKHLRLHLLRLRLNRIQPRPRKNSSRFRSWFANLISILTRRFPMRHR